MRRVRTMGTDDVGRFDEEDDWGDEESLASFHLDAEPPAEHTYSVPEFVEHLNALLREEFSGAWVTGEIEGWNGRGQHAYFSLVAAAPDGSKAVLNASLFSFHRKRLEGVLQRAGLTLADGVKVRVRGTPDFYAPFGKLSLKVNDIDANFTLGDLVMARQELVRSLRERGLYDANRRHELPAVPLRVGLVTSVGSAAYADFTKEISSSGIGFDLRVIDVRVQGATAPAEVAAAIAEFGRHGDRDVVVVIRGGGSRSDLAAFDTEEIAAAIAHSPLPVLTGIGHEIDTSVADEVAHTRFKTPTAAAAGLVARVGGFVDEVERAWVDIGSLVVGHLAAATDRLGATAGGIAQHVRSGVERSTARLESRSQRLGLTARHEVERADGRLAASLAVIGRAPASIDHGAVRLEALAERLRLLDPVTTMSRGWSITRTIDGRTVRDVADLAVGEVLVTTFQSGTATSRVEEIQS